MSAAHRLVANRASPEQIIAELEAIGRSRALDAVESLLLEHCLREDLARPVAKAITTSLSRELARAGLDRDRLRYRAARSAAG